jgi:hypothetical protein
MFLEWLYGLDLSILYPLVVALIVGAAILANWIGLRRGAKEPPGADISTLTGAALGIVGLLIAFSFSIALSNYDIQRTMILEEANAIGSTANFAQMLPQPARGKILTLLRDYTEIRITLGVPYSVQKLRQDIARSLYLQNQLWQQAILVTAAEPQSLPAYRFVASLNDVNNIHERRITALRYHVPAAVMFTLVGVAMVGMGFTGYHSGVSGSRRWVANLLMSFTVAVLVLLIIDLNRPDRGLIETPNTALVDALAGIGP